MKRVTAALGGALLAMAMSGHALAGICDLKIYHSDRGERSGEASRYFAPADQFVACFRATKDGYVTLWDRMPSSGPIERLAPNDNFTGDGERAVKVSAGDRRCFGDGAEGYLLFMDPADGVGTGFMWLVFTDVEDTQPVDGQYASTGEFQQSFERLGAGSMAAISGGSAAAPATRGECAPQKALRYPYRVQ